MSHRLLTLELRIPPLALTAAAALGMALVAIAWPSYIPTPTWVHVCAAGLALVAVVLCLSAVVAFRGSRTTVNPLEPAAASTVVMSGAYQFSRNPMYLAFLLLLIAWAICLANVPASIALPLFVLYMNRFQIEPEERALIAKFGEPYQNYMAQVRRWA